ncbi:cellulase family glycosylhydrolase [Niabella sp. 22666]|uniref:cellulase family glycosylhydrolase n=1 Tax=Niabella sp. 22666 TaxID=3453954 RepID=UPI003F87DD7E
MKKVFVVFYLLPLIICGYACNKNAIAQAPEKPQQPGTEFAAAATINQRLGRGINLGNTWESSWDKKESTPADFEKIAAKGFTSVRLPIRWEMPDRTQFTPPYTINNTFLNKIKSAVDDALKNKLHVIINMHHHDSLYARPDELKPMFLAQWKQIAAVFKNYPDSLLFEVLNEPHGNLDAGRWNNFFAEALQTIRETNPKRTVLLGLAEWGGVSALGKLSVPQDEHLILTIHYYNPFHFTHQGASWTAGSDAWLGTRWRDTELDRQEVKDDFKAAIEFAKTKSIPINVGEFGAYSTADMDSRIKWTRFMARYFEQQQFSWNYWEFNSGFGIYDPAKNTYNTGLVNALTADAMAAPTPVTFINLYTSNFLNPQADGWRLYNNDASASSTLGITNGKAVITIASQGTQTWYIQLIRANTSIETGKTYRLTFNATSDSNRNISLAFQQSSTPWLVYGSKQFGITKNEENYQYVFTAASTDAKTNLLFSLGKNGLAPVTLSNIKLEEIRF